MSRISNYNDSYTEIIVDVGKIDSTLEVPNGRNPNQNAWLTLTINYSLNFIDSKNPAKNYRGDNIILGNRGEGQFLAVDSNNERLPIKDWDSQSKQAFHRTFKQGERFWNHKFALETPKDYSALDFKGADGWLYRPNILCLFRLNDSERTPHLTNLKLNIVRLDTEDFFRANELLYNHNLTKNTLWHELGHALGQDHIQTLAGTQIGKTICVTNPERDECYETPDGMGGENIMGRSRLGAGLHPLNAEPWLKRVETHTKIPSGRWIARMSTNIPPKRIRRA